MLVHIRSLRDQVRNSLFYIPMVFVLGAILLAEVMLEVDQRVEDVPERLTATVDSARTVLSVVASATLTFAGVAFSVSLLLISLSSSQYSPRVVHGLFRDPFNKRVMGFVIGTFTYCLVVMRAVRAPLEEAGAPVVPSVSVLLAVVLGIVSVLSIVAFISHTAHSMDVSKLLHDATEESLQQLRSSGFDEESDDDPRPARPNGDGYAIDFATHGWIQQIDHRALLDAVDPSTCVLVETTEGGYAIPNTTVCRLWPDPSDPDAVERGVRGAIVIGETRTSEKDPTYGVRQLADVALKALSPGINDPTTAQDALFHLGTVVRELLVRTPPPQHLTAADGRVLLLPAAVTHQEVVGLAFDEVRLASIDQPTVQIYLLEMLHLLDRSLGPDRDEARAALRQQADLVWEVSERADLVDHDHARVREAYRNRFG